MKLSFDLDVTSENQVSLAIFIDDDVVWPHPNRDDGASDFDPEDVISYLADAWQSLLLTQSWPIVFDADQEPRSITGLQRAAEERWDQLGDDDEKQVASEQSSLDQFLYHHDLSQMKFGSGLPPLYVLREQKKLRIETATDIRRGILFNDFINELTNLGEFSIKILENRSTGKDSAARAISRWNERAQFDPIDVASRIAGIPRIDLEASRELLDEFVGDFANRTLMEIANDNANPVYAAARSSGILGPVSLAEVVRQIRAIPSGDVSELKKLRVKLLGNLRDIAKPTDQGIRAAAFIREWLAQGDDVRIDLDTLSERIKIRVKRIDVPDGRLDGIASNSSQHGPAILLNTKTRRQGAGPEDLERSLRFTWAHEIGHLLLDEEDWPALVDALEQRVPRTIETRANAFATYLLLPEKAAYRYWENQSSPLDWDSLQAILNELTGKFGLPRIAASRQITRGAPPERRKQLEILFQANNLKP